MINKLHFQEIWVQLLNTHNVLELKVQSLCQLTAEETQAYELLNNLLEFYACSDEEYDALTR